MRSRNRLETVDVVELGRHLITEQPTSTAGADGPGVDVFWVTPHKIAESTFVGNLLGTCYHPDLVDCSNLRTQAAVHAEHGAIHYGGKDKEVKDLAASFPDGSVAVFLLAFFVESVDLRDLTRLMVASNEDDAVRVSGSAGQPKSLTTLEGGDGPYFALRHMRSVKVSKLK